MRWSIGFPPPLVVSGISRLAPLLATIKSELVKLGPLIGLDPNQLLLLQGAENQSPVAMNGSEPAASAPLRRRSPGMGVSSA